jgi:hypothetical protein
MMRSLVAAAFLLAWTPAPAVAQVTIQFGVPNVAIGIDLPVFPRMVRVPGSPVYYSPVVNGNYFFYDGMYWVFQGDAWYASAWFNGPWAVVPPQAVPAFVLRIPVRYYRVPPPFFRGWRPDGPPRWGEHWGADWARERAGWDRWSRDSVPRPAPLPLYQKEYAGSRYPQPRLQPALHDRNYPYWPHDAEVRRAYLANGMRGAVVPHARGSPAGSHAQPGRGSGHDHGG